MIANYYLFFKNPDETPKAPNQVKPFLKSSIFYSISVYEKLNFYCRFGICLFNHYKILLRLKKRKDKLYKKYLVKSGTVDILSTLYIKLRFQNDIIPVKK